MEEQAPTPRPPKSAHVIDLRQSAAAQAAKVADKAPETSAPAPKPSKKRVVEPATAPVVKETTSSYAQAAAPTPTPVPAAAAAIKPAQKDAVPADFFDAPPPRRRFWPAFWRFLFLLIVLGLIICGGLYLYLKLYNP